MTGLTNKNMIEKYSKMKAVVEAAKEWRKTECDMEDVQMAQSGECKCATCKLIQIVDELEAS